MAFTPEQEAALLNLIAQPAKIISDLESEVSLNGDELIPVEDGSGTFGATVNDIADYTIAEGFVGFVLPYSKNTPPTGWLECNGAAISRTTYSDLFAVTGTVFGVGNGSTTFNIPDLRGYFPRGWDNGRGVDSGRAFGSTQTDALQNITGGINLIGNSKTIPITGTGAFSFTSTSTSEFAGGGGYANTNGPLTFDASRVARTSTETRSINLALMYCIKY